jgi:glycosyltransferase involved in cell wall biosynthesis
LTRIVIVEPDGYGGLAHFAYQLAQALAEAGVAVTLVTAVDYELAAWPHRCRLVPSMHLWSPVETVATSTLARLRRRLGRPLRRVVRGGVVVREWWRLAAFLRREAPDVVLFGIIRFPFELFWLHRLRAAGIPLAQICHEFDTREVASPLVRHWHRRLSRRIYAQFVVVFFLSEATRRTFLEAFAVDPARTVVVPHGPELLFPVSDAAVAALRARYGVAATDRVFLFFGGLRPSKGVPDLVDAFARLPARPDVRLIVAGYPSRHFDVGGLRRRIAAAGVEDRVHLDLRYLPMAEIGPLVALATAVVLPYRNATASGAVALAQSLGRPVVATATGGLAEMIEDGVSGRLVPPGDVTALAAAMAAVLDEPAAARAMGARGRHAARVERSWEVVARRVLAALADRTPPPQPAADRARAGSARKAAG